MLFVTIHEDEKTNIGGTTSCDFALAFGLEPAEQTPTFLHKQPIYTS